jgi:hypothetical protein
MVWPDILFYVRVILESDYQDGPARRLRQQPGPAF